MPTKSRHGFTDKNQGDRSLDTLKMSDHGPVPLIFPLIFVPLIFENKKGRPLPPQT
jgi:hypothetical protein